MGEENVPLHKKILEILIGDPEVTKMMTLQTKTVKQVSLSDHLVKFSFWSHAVSAVACIRRHVIKDKSNAHSTVSERQDAELIVIKDLQKQVYAEEIKILSKGNQLPSNGKLCHLDIFLDRDAVFKVGGSRHSSALPHSFKHPTVITREHHVTKLIIAHYYERVKHQGKGFAINEIRSNGFWIPGISRTVTPYIHSLYGLSETTETWGRTESE